MSNKNRFNSFSRANLTSWGNPTLKIWGKMVIWKNWLKTRILTLD